MDAFMARMQAHAAEARKTHDGLKTANPLTGVYDAGPVPETHCLRMNLIGATDAHGFTAVSVSHPPDVDLDTIEIALVGADGRLVYIDRLGMSDIYRFSSLGELVDGLVRLANNLPVYEDEDEDDDQNDE
tara:strand:- start:178 stop:567 length:390 start_codon:yes stop_codon:yes gene_type:complete